MKKYSIAQKCDTTKEGRENFKALCDEANALFMRFSEAVAAHSEESGRRGDYQPHLMETAEVSLLAAARFLAMICATKQDEAAAQYDMGRAHTFLDGNFENIREQIKADGSLVVFKKSDVN